MKKKHHAPQFDLRLFPPSSEPFRLLQETGEDPDRLTRERDAVARAHDSAAANQLPLVDSPNPETQKSP